MVFNRLFSNMENLAVWGKICQQTCSAFSLLQSLVKTVSKVNEIYYLKGIHSGAFSLSLESKLERIPKNL